MKKIESVKLQDLDNSLFDDFQKDELDNLVAVVGGRGGAAAFSESGPDNGDATVWSDGASDTGTGSDGDEVKF